MNKLFKQIGRIFKSLRRLFSITTGKITRGTGTVVKATGGAIGAGAAILVLFIVLIVIGIAAIPYGAFDATKDNTTQEEVQAKASGIVDITSESTHCEKCGQTGVELISSGYFINNKEISLCKDCSIQYKKEGEEDEKSPD